MHLQKALSSSEIQISRTECQAEQQQPGKQRQAAGGLTNEEGDVSREAVKVKVKTIIDAEDKRKPLSDLVLANKLADAGIKASRRVVTKYREELGIPDSRVRRRH